MAPVGHSPFGENGSGNSRFVPGGEVVPFAGGVLGSDYNHRYHPVIAGASLGGFLATFVGTLVGAALGAIVASYFAPNAVVFGVCMFGQGLLCAAVGTDRSAYRFGGVTLAMVLLLPHVRSPWIAAFHRSAEVSIGIGVALIFSVVWPEEEEVPLLGMPFSYLAKAASGDAQVRI
jgi:hypothetical protein